MFAVAALAGGGTGIARSAFAQSTQQVTVDGARKVLADLRHDKAFGSAGDLIRRAKGVLIVPRLIKGGFIVGGEGGNGVLMVRRRTGWSDPAFYAIGAASFGLQAGLEQSELILLVMSEKGLNGIMQDQFKIGAQAGITVVTLGSGVEGALSGANLPDIVVWSSTTGLYGGLTIDGSVIRSQPSMDAAYYGRPMRTHDVLFGSQNAAQAAALRREIAAIG
jgi:lipid-binding SYLF domain-containing protein